MNSTRAQADQDAGDDYTERYHAHIQSARKAAAFDARLARIGEFSKTLMDEVHPSERDEVGLQLSIAYQALKRLRPVVQPNPNEPGRITGRLD